MKNINQKIFLKQHFLVELKRKHGKFHQAYEVLLKLRKSNLSLESERYAIDRN